MKPEILPDPSILESTPEQNGGTVNRARRDDDRLPRADDREGAVRRAKDGADAPLPRGARSEEVKSFAGRGGSSRGRGEEQSLDGRLDEEAGPCLGGIGEPGDSPSLLLAVRTAEAAKSARVRIPAGVLLRNSKCKLIPSQKGRKPRRTGMLAA